QNWAYEATLNIYQTGLVDHVTNGWEEEHFFTNLAHIKQPKEDIWRLWLNAVDLPDEQLQDETTLFDCADDGTLSFVMRIYDSAGELADCAVWGHSPPDVLAGNVSANGVWSTTAPEEINEQNCNNWNHN
ncbi:MAG: hypothetical protein HN348_19920, partial [Proteobacteria bacterium]|nr:hypothetical protein [Pseudomonadota bacterium]